jgi:tetratricopeptide (TPR) repeat protein
MPTFNAAVQFLAACRNAASRMEAFFRDHSPELVILSGDWLEYTRAPRFESIMADLRGTVEKLNARGIRVVLLGPPVQFKGRLPPMLLRLHMRGVAARADDLLLPEVVSLPPTSLKGARQFFLKLTTQGIPYYQAVIGMELEKAQNAAGIQYGKALLKFVRRLTAEEAARAALTTLPFEAFSGASNRPSGTTIGAGDDDGQYCVRYQIERAQLSETLAQVVLASGRTDEARGLFQDALRDNPSLSPAAMSLATLAESAGNASEALEFYAHALLAKPSQESRKRFSEAWSKVKGSTDGQQKWLDERYKLLFPSPLHPVKYAPTAKRTRRVVLGELYTGAGCPPCLAADLAFDSMLERYPRTDFVFVAYHQHIPRPDPMANPDTIARWKGFDGSGVPTFMIDGIVAGNGGGPRYMARPIEKQLVRQIDAQLETEPLAGLGLSARLDGSSLTASARIESLAVPPGDLVLTLVLVEKELTYSGENSCRFHPMVARAVANYPLRQSEPESLTHRFDLAAVEAALVKHIDDFEKHDERHNKDGNFRFAERKTALDANHLAVVAFVQDTKTRKVLQAAYSDPARR